MKAKEIFRTPLNWALKENLWFSTWAEGWWNAMQEGIKEQGNEKWPLFAQDTKRILNEASNFIESY